MRDPRKQKAEDLASIGEMDFKDGLNVFKFFALVGAMPFNVLLHYGEGDRFYSTPALVAFLLMLGSIEYAPELAYFLPVWTLLLIGKRVGVNRKEHSKFWGYSRLRFVFRSERLARTMEPFVVFAIGVAIAPYSAGMSDFCIGGAIALFVVLCIEMHEIQEMKRRIRDGRAEMEWQSRLSRGNSGW
jgi:hypothetical protein